MYAGLRRIADAAALAQRLCYDDAQPIADRSRALRGIGQLIIGEAFALDSDSNMKPEHRYVDS